MITSCHMGRILLDNPFLTNVPLENIRNLGFSGLFRGYNLGTVDAAIKPINARRIK